jgi:hypothetical protein
LKQQGEFLLCHYAMFVRFRQTAQRLQASLVETRRIDGKVRHEHIAGLGSVEMAAIGRGPARLLTTAA